MRTTVGFVSCALGALLGAWVSAEAQPAPPGLVADCGGTFNLCGFRDRTTKAEVIPRRFERVSSFSEGLAAVRFEGRYGYIDERGEMVIAPQYDLASGFYQGLAEVLIGDKTGVIDRAGRFVLPPRLGRSIPFTTEVVIAQEGPWKSFTSQDGDTLPNPFIEFGSFYGAWGLYHVRDGWLTKPEYTFEQFDKSGRGLIWARRAITSSEPFGLLRADGTWAIEPQFSYVEPLRGDRAVVGVPDPNNTRDRLQGIVDPDGALVLPPGNRRAFGWGNGFTVVQQDGKYRLIDRSGNFVDGRIFDDVRRARDLDDMLEVMVDGKKALLDQNANIIPEPYVVGRCPSGMTLLKPFTDNVRTFEAESIRVVDAQGQPTVPYALDYAPFGQRLVCDRPNAVRVGVKWTFLATNGRLLFDPAPFESVFEFAGGYAIVKRDGKWGLIDTIGRFVLEPQFDELRPAGTDGVGPFTTGVYSARHRFGLPLPAAGAGYDVKKGAREYTISATGQELPSTPRPDPRADFLACPFGAKLVSRTGLFGFGAAWGLVDTDGREIIRPQYRALHCFRNGVAWAPIDSKRQWCPVGPDGAVRTEPACIATRDPSVPSHSYPERLADDPYESSVLWSRAYLEYGAGRRATPPLLRGDGARGGTGSFPAMPGAL